MQTTYCAIRRTTNGRPFICAPTGTDRPIPYRRALRILRALTDRFERYGAPAMPSPSPAPAPAAPSPAPAPAAPSPAPALVKLPAFSVTKLASQAAPKRAADDQQTREAWEEAYLIDGWQSDRRY